MKTSVRALSPLWRVIFCVCFASATFAQTQSSARLAGTVTDPAGAAIAGAEVVAQPVGGVAAPSTGPQRAVSTAEGFYVLTVAPGRYRITVTHASFSTVEQEIMLGAGETRDLPIRMLLEPLSSSVVVTAQAVPVSVDSASSAVTIITASDIRRRYVTSVPDLLSTQPGFSLGRTGPLGGTASLFLDGGNSSFTKVLVDGIPMSPPGGLMNFSNFTIDNVEKIEIVHGAESALYGSDAMTGAIQIFTRRGTTRTPEFTGFYEGGNFDTGRGGGDLSGLLGRFDYSAGAVYLKSAGQGPNNSFRNRTLSGNFGWRFSDTARISLSLRDNVSDAGIPGATLLFPPSLDTRSALHNFNAGLRAEFKTGTHWQHVLKLTESYNRQSDINPFFPTFFQFNRTNAGAQTSYVTRTAGLTAGYEYEVENGFISFIGAHARRNNHGGYVDLRWHPVNRLTLSAGMRVEDNASFGRAVVPRAGIGYALRVDQGAFGDTRLRGSFGQGIKEARFDQTYGSDPCFPGNPVLLPERSRSIHAGIEQKLAFDRVRVTADYFDNRFRDIISFQFITGPPGCTFGAGTFFNTNLARARGVNLASEARLARWLTMSGNYTYNSTRVLSAPNAFDDNYVPGNRLLRRPVHSGSLMFNTTLHRVNWNVSGYFTGKRLDSDFLGSGPSNNPGYARFDMAASYDLARARGISLYGRLANFTNKQYQEALGYPALGREFRLGIRYTTRHE